MAEEKKIFAGGGMDMDTEERLLKSNDYRYALNCRITSPDEENEGTVENVRGNTLLNSGLTTSSGVPLSAPRFKVIGHYEDKKLNILYYFVCDIGPQPGGIAPPSGGAPWIPEHCIVTNYRWNASLGGRPGNFMILLQDSGLNFQQNNLITGVNMIHSQEFARGGILYWTDDYNPPCKLNILRAYWWRVSPGSVATPILSYQEPPVLHAIPKAPTDPPLVNIGTWIGKNSNYIKGSLWQFKYRYIYLEAEKSSWSPISESVTSHTSVSNIASLQTDNYIQLRLVNGRTDVVAIDIAARKNGTGDDFYLVGTVKKDNSTQQNITLSSFGNPGIITIADVKTMIPDSLANWTNIFFIFTGEEPRIPIDLQESNKLYDDVPLLAKSQEIVDGNRLVYGNIVNGYDPVPTDTELSVVYKETDDTIGLVTHINHTVSVSTKACKWTAGINSRSLAKYSVKIHVPDMTTRQPGEKISLKMDGISFATALQRWDTLGCGFEYGSQVVKIDFDSLVYSCTGSDTIATLRNHMENNCITRFTNMYQEFTSPDAKMKVGAGHGEGSNCIGDTELTSLGQTNGSTAAYTGGSVGSKLWDSSGNDIVLRFEVWHEDNLNVGTCSAYNFWAVIGFDGEEILYNYNICCPFPTFTSSPGMPIAASYIDGDGDHSTAWTSDAYLKVRYLHNFTNEFSPYDLESNMILVAVPIQEPGNYRGFKSGTRHNFGLVYYDHANRSGTVNKAGSVYIPSRNERDSSITDFTAHVHFKIYHRPPDWASHYQWVHSSERIEQFKHITVNTIEYDANVKARYNTVLQDSQTDEAGVIEPGYQAIIESSGFTHGAVIMDMEELIKHSSTSSENNFLWDWKKGDRVKIIDTVNYTGNDWEIIGVIEDVLGNYGSATSTPKLWFVLEHSTVGVVQTGGTANDVHVEIYRPAPESEDIYYEFNHTNRIGSANGVRIHKANSWPNGYNEGQLTTMGYTNVYVDDLGVNTPLVFSYDQDYAANPDVLLPAEGTFLNGDVYIRNRLMVSASLLILAEDYSASDFWPSKAWDLGRPNAYLPDFKQTRRDSTIFFSELFIPNTAINGLGNFYPDVSFQEYDKSFNSIQKLFSINDKLIILQEDKVSKAMVSRTVLFDASAEQNVAISQNVLSSSIPYIGDFGISRNPESFANFGFRSYFVDIKRRVVLRLSQDGLTSISEHKMKNFFTDYFQEVVDNKRHTSRAFKIYGAYDNKFDEYVVSIQDIDWETEDHSGLVTQHNIPGFTIGFHEPSKRWNSFYGYQNYIATYNSELHSFLNGYVYQHNAAVDSSTPPRALYNNFYGANWVSILEFPLNLFPDTNKLFHSISEHANNIWEVNALYTRNGQLTDIPFLEFTNAKTYTWEEGHGTKENIHNATIRCDVLTPGVINPKIEGDRMRDTSAMCRLVLPVPKSQEQNVLFSLRFGFILSSNPSLIENQ